jgi:putative transposase
MVAHLGAYPWSSTRAHAAGAADRVVSDHPLTQVQGRDPAERRAAYRALFRQPLDAAFVAALRTASNGGWALGDERFRNEIAEALGRRVAPLPPGRPRRKRGENRTLTPFWG